MVERHEHTGQDSPKLRLNKCVQGAPLQALTARNTNSLSSGGTENLISSDAQVIENLRTRLNELEDRLRLLGLLK